MLCVVDCWCKCQDWDNAAGGRRVCIGRSGRVGAVLQGNKMDYAFVTAGTLTGNHRKQACSHYRVGCKPKHKNRPGRPRTQGCWRKTKA